MLTIDEIKSADGVNTKVEVAGGKVWVAGYWYEYDKLQQLAVAIMRAESVIHFEPAMNLMRDRVKAAEARTTEALAQHRKRTKRRTA